MAQAPLKSAPVIPLDSRRQERAPARPGWVLPQPHPASRGGRRLMGFLALSALLHGAAMLLPWPRPAPPVAAPVRPEPLVVNMAAPATPGETTAPSPVATPPRARLRPPLPAKRAEAEPAARESSPPVQPSRSPAVPEPPPTPAASDPPPTPAASKPPPQVAAQSKAEPGVSAPAPTAVAPAPGTLSGFMAAPAAPTAPVRPPSFSAAYLNNPPPAYPLSARRMGQEGTVVLRVLVNDGGHPDQVQLARGSGFPVLDEAALQAVQRWTFVPARRGDIPTAGWVEVPVRFQLEHN